MSLSSNFPTIRPTLLLDFANTGVLDPRVTFARASTARYYDASTVAKAEENLLVQSQDFATTWAIVNTTITTNSLAAPDGTTTADTVTDNATSAQHTVRQSFTATVNIPYSFSCFLQKGTSNFGYLLVQDGGTAERYFVADFNLDTGVVRTSAAGTSGTLTSATITSVGGGWYRCAIIGQLSAGTSLLAAVGISDGTTAPNTFGAISFSGTGSTIYAWGAQLEQRSAVTAYTPTTTQPITNYIPVLLTAQNDVPRFDHNPTTRAALGLLIEEQRTNSFTYSDDFADATWTKTNSSITANTIVAPDGTLTGDKLVEDAANASHFVTKSVASVSGTTYVMSIFAKQAESGRYLTLLFGGGTYYSGEAATFNLTTGVVESTAGTTTATITAVGNGWYRCSITAVSKSTGTPSGAERILINNSTSSSSFTYTGDGYSGIYIWGAQLEAGAFPTSYIPTTTTALTRNADVASMTGTNFSSWFNASSGSLLAQYNPIAVSGTQYIAAMDNGAGFADSCILYMVSSGFPRWDVFVSSSSQAALTPAPATAISANTSLKLIGAYLVNDFAASRNGGTVSTDISGTVPTLSRLTLGNSNLTTQFLNGHLQRIAYYPTRLPNAQLQALTI